MLVTEVDSKRLERERSGGEESRGIDGGKPVLVEIGEVEGEVKIEGLERRER